MNNTLSVSELLVAWSDGDSTALEHLAPLVQDELQRIANHYLRGERQAHLLQTADLVNEAWVRLIGWNKVTWRNRAHFFSVAAKLMRRILVDEARERLSQKRGGGAIHVSLTLAANIGYEPAMEMLALDEALNQLDHFDKRKSCVVELCLFAGLSFDEAADILKISSRTVRRDWDAAHLWLLQRLKHELN